MIDVREILKEVSSEYGIPGNIITNKSRTKLKAEAFQVFLYLCRKFTRYSYSELGFLFERDHSTVVYSFRKINNIVEHKYPESIYKTVAKIRYRIGGI